MTRFSLWKAKRLQQFRRSRPESYKNTTCYPNELHVCYFNDSAFIFIPWIEHSKKSLTAIGYV